MWVKDGGYILWVYMMSMDNLRKTGGIIISEKQHDLFLSTLNEAKTKYTERVTIAKENNVTDLSKSMIYKVEVGSFFAYGGETYFQFVVDLIFNI